MTDKHPAAVPETKAQVHPASDSDRGDTGFPGKRKHAATKDCWCEPELDYVAPDGTKVWKHRATQ